MKKQFYVFTALLIFILLLSINQYGLAQTPPPPPPNGGHGLSGSQAPSDSGAPIGDGMFILIGLAGSYAGKKIYNQKKRIPTIKTCFYIATFS